MADDAKYLSDLEKATLANNLTTVQSLVDRNSTRLESSLKLIARLAAQKGNLAILQYAMKKQPSILETECVRGQTPAHIAASNGHRNLFTFIAEQKPFVLALQNSRRETPLYLAIKKDIIRNVRTLRFFVDEKGVPLTHLDDLAYIAAAKGKLHILKYIVGLDATVLTKKYDQNRNLAHIAAVNGHPKIVRYLIRRATSLLNEKDPVNNNILHMMMQRKSKDVNTFKFLGEHGISLLQKNFYGKDAAYFAAENGNVDALRYIEKEHPSILETKYDRGRNVAHIAVSYGQWQIVRYVAQKRPDLLAVVDDSGNTILHTAAYRDNVNKETLRYLLEEEAVPIPLNATNQGGETIADIAIRRKNFPFIQYFAERMPSLLVTDNLLHSVHTQECALNSNARTLKLFVENCGPIFAQRSDFKLVEENGYFNMLPYLMAKDPPPELASRAVHDALGNNPYYPLVVKYLIGERKVDVNILNERAESPIFTAVRKGHRNMIEYLAGEQNANLSIANADGDNILFLAVEKCDLDTLKYLLGNRTAPIDLNWRNKLGDTVLHAAVFRVLESVGVQLKVGPVKARTMEVLEYLVGQKGIDLNARGHEGKTCLHHAALRPNINICLYLREHGADPEIRDVLGRTYWDVALFNRTGLPYVKCATFNRTRRLRRSVRHPPRYFSSILPSMPYKQGEQTLDANYFEIGGVDLSANNQERLSSQFQNFLTIGKWMLGKTEKSSVTNYVPSSATIIQSKIDAAAMAAVDVISR